MPKTRNNPRFRIDTRSEKKADQTCFILLFQAQTPQQRRANNTFAKAEERKRGKPQGEVLRKEKPAKAPISKTWVCKCLSTFPIHSFHLLGLYWSAGVSEGLKSRE
ncbi:hypothetical protein D0867_15277 [Hortaea werneckii]|uniref:Stress-associated endoplasmic reticulum protein n=1 Tax=Hortaea werneckii TaxID=91943 RepID=A0A3M6YNC5_HORWE|nr:hypothetical protein D0867_15277 [Hortaea werneckii]RMY04397.1 hypothetical protein D0866_15350 [Hortaea werneckii]